MPLTEEWRHRINRWQTVLWASCYRPLGKVALNGFVTLDQLSEEEALQRKFQPMPTGTPWGAKWEYGWFKGSFSLPAEAKGKRIVLCPDAGGESLVWVNGLVAGSRGWAHKDLTLTRNANGGESYEVLIEAYAGHGPISVGGGPVRYGTTLMPEPGPTQTTVGDTTFGVWLEDVYQLALDFTTLTELRAQVDPLSLRAARIDEALFQATLVADLELPEDEMIATVIRARECLKPVLAAHNGSTAPELYAFGHAHIDVAWLWPLAETERKIARTAINQLALFEEYPDFRFLQSQPHLYWMLEKRYPELYQRFKAAIQQGKVIPDGAMWVEADTNVSGGEALIRQVMYGRRFFQQEFNFDSKILWLPDVFGYSGAMPQILAGCGVEGFSTQKITWAYGGGDRFPYNTFWWEGIDGTAIPAHIFTEYNSQTSPKFIAERWNTRLQKHGINSMILSFGWGDGGGGPERNHVEYLRRERDLEGLPKVRLSSPAEFFADLKKQGMPKERYVGELYFQAHRGTYTSQARTKRGNRKSEIALREAEFWGTVAAVLKGFDFGPRTLQDDWRMTLLNQFHDILPGSSIHRVYEEAEAGHAQVIENANRVASDAAAALTHRGAGFTVFNSLPWSRYVIIDTPTGPTEVTVPACGWYSTSGLGDLKPSRSQDKVSAQIETVPDGTRYVLENTLIRAEFNPRGELVRLWDKPAQSEWLTTPANVFHLYKDVPDIWDAWDVNSMTESAALEVTLDEPVEIEVLQSGPLSASLRLCRKLHDSELEQIITLNHSSRRIDFITTVDWQESHKLLKVNFPVAVHANEAISEIQFGHLRRPTHQSRPYDADRFEICNHKWSALAEENRGAAVLNDCKYGLSAKGNSLNLTLLKAGLAPDPQADRGAHQFTYALYTWNGAFFNSGVVQQAYELNVSPLVLPGDVGESSLFKSSASNIVVETLKLAEDDSGDIIVRLYEAMHTATRCTLQVGLPLKQAWECNLIEEVQQPLVAQEGSLTLNFRPFEIKTLRIKY
jgi:alpha-mannosidase